MRVIANELIKTLDDPYEASVLARHWSESDSVDASKLAGLSSSGETVLSLLSGVDAAEADALFSTPPSEFREGLATVSPLHHVAGLRARLLVMHDRFDDVVPVTESRRLLDATEDRLDVRYTEFLSFNHMRPGPGSLPTRLGQAIRLCRHMYNVIHIAQ